MEVEYLFAGIGLIIILGFMGSLFFERTKIPDILILIFIGLLIGPILTQYTDIGLLDDLEMADTITFIAPHFAALALVIILFDGGLNLHLEKTMRKMGISLLHTCMAFIGSVVVTALVCKYLLDMDMIIGLLLGSIIGGTSGAIVISLAMKSCAREDTKILLTLESVLTDVLCIVMALIFIEILLGSDLDTGALISKLLGSFVIAGFIALGFGVAWLFILKKLAGKQFAFMITIAALLLLYAICEYIHVSGAIAALVFGLVLSNKDEIARIMKFKGRFVLDDNIKQFHSEVSFLIRTFFFVYLGITFTFTINSSTFGELPSFIPVWLSEHPIMMLLAFLAVLFTGIFAVRYISATVTCLVHKDSKPDKSYIYTMLPRGLAAAVLAQVPFTLKEYTGNIVNNVVLPIEEQTQYYQTMSPYQNLFLNVVFMIIVLSVIVTSVGVFVIERKRMNSDACIAPDPKAGGDWAAKSPTYKKSLEQKPATAWKPKTEPKKWEAPAHPEPQPQKKAPQPAKTTVSHPQPQKPVPRQAASQRPAAQQPYAQKTAPRPATANRPVPQQPQAHRPAQTPKPAPQAQQKHHAQPHKPQGDHPLVKRAVESEKTLPKKPVQEPTKGKPKK